MSNEFHNQLSKDQELERLITDSLARHNRASLRNVRVRVQDNKVVLRGEVGSFYAKQLSQHSARRLAGDNQVIDEVGVATPATFAERSRLAHVAVAGLLLMALVFVTGCDDESYPLPVFPVTGQVLVDGRPAAGATLVFHSKDADAVLPRPRAVVDQQGNFSLSTYGAADGAPAGEYVVTLEWRPFVKNGRDFEPGPNVLPPKYRAPTTTDVRAQIAEGANVVPIRLVR